MRFYFEEETGMCKPFYYGGCGGNKNNFRTMAECYKACEGPCNNNDINYILIIIIVIIKNIILIIKYTHVY